MPRRLSRRDALVRLGQDFFRDHGHRSYMLIEDSSGFVIASVPRSWSVRADYACCVLERNAMIRTHLSILADLRNREGVGRSIRVPC